MEEERIEEPKKKSLGEKKLFIIRELLFYGILFFLCFFVIPKYVVEKTIVDGNSMEMTLHHKDQLMIDKISYRFFEPSRFDIIVFYPYGKEVKEYYVKRIIGLPGETIQIKGSQIFINEEELVESFGKDPITNPGIAREPILLAKDEYFVLGDNRSVSLDSRYEEVGPIHRDLISGKAMFRIWPLDQFGFLK